MGSAGGGRRGKRGKGILLGKEGEAVRRRLLGPEAAFGKEAERESDESRPRKDFFELGFKAMAVISFIFFLFFFDNNAQFLCYMRSKMFEQLEKL